MIKKILFKEMNLHYRKIDLGRLILIPIFTLFMSLNLFALYRDLKFMYPLNLINVIRSIHHLLIVSFYILLILLYFLRTSPLSTSKSLITNIIAILTAFVPFIIPVLGRSGFVNLVEILISSIIIIFGMILSISALWALGRNVSIIPQARKLVKSGVYKWVRHPLYLGEIICVFGISIVEITIFKMIVLLLFISAQIYRSINEEKLLREIFLEYDLHFSKRNRFIPGIF